MSNNKNNQRPRTPYGLFTFAITDIDKKDKRSEMTSYNLCRKMGFINLYQLFNAGYSKMFVHRLEEITGLKVKWL